MNRCLLVGLVGLGASLCALPTAAQLTPTQLRMHRERIENSRRLNKTVWSYDTIFHKGEAYGILRAVGGANRDFSVFALHNPHELILVQNLMRVRQGSIEVLFRFLDEAGGQAVLRSSLDVRDFVARVLVDEKLLTPTGLNRAAVQHFLRKYGTTDTDAARSPDPDDPESATDDDTEPTDRSTTQPAASSPARNRNATLLLTGNEIYQGGQLLGHFKRENKPDLPQRHQYTIYDLNDQPIATVYEDTSNALVLITARDHRQHRLVPGSPDYDTGELALYAAVKYLVKYFYL